MQVDTEHSLERAAPPEQESVEAKGSGRVIEPHVAWVVLADPKAVKGATQTAKTDKLDARTLAKLLAAGFLPEVWTPDERTRALRRRISRRAQLVRQRTHGRISKQGPGEARHARVVCRERGGVQSLVRRGSRSSLGRCIREGAPPG